MITLRPRPSAESAYSRTASGRGARRSLSPHERWPLLQFLHRGVHHLGVRLGAHQHPDQGRAAIFSVPHAGSFLAPAVRPGVPGRRRLLAAAERRLGCVCVPILPARRAISVPVLSPVELECAPTPRRRSRRASANEAPPPRHRQDPPTGGHQRRHGFWPSRVEHLHSRTRAASSSPEITSPFELDAG